MNCSFQAEEDSVLSGGHRLVLSLQPSNIYLLLFASHPNFRGASAATTGTTWIPPFHILKLQTLNPLKLEPMLGAIRYISPSWQRVPSFKTCIRMTFLQNTPIASTKQPREELLQIVSGSGAKLHWWKIVGIWGAEMRLLGYQCISFMNGRQMESTLILTAKAKICCAL